MVLDICGGEASKAEIAGKPPKPNAPFAFDPKLVRKLSGLDLTGGEIKKLLTALGIELKGNPPKLKAAPPSWRPDISVPVDLVEEVVRLVGVDHVPATPMTREAGVARPVLTEMQIARAARAPRACRTRAGRGRHLVVHPAGSGKTVRRRRGRAHSKQSDLDRACGDAAMAPAGLVTAAQRNRDRGFADGALFELGQAYRGPLPEDQFVAAAGVRFGHSALQGSGRDWSGEAPEADVFAAKADAVAALAALGIDQGASP